MGWPVMMCRQASSIPSQLKHSEEERKSSLLGYHIRPNRKMEHLVVGKITEEKAEYDCSNRNKRFGIWREERNGRKISARKIPWLVFTDRFYNRKSL